MCEPTQDRCGYTWPEDYEISASPAHQSCCYRQTVSGGDRCAWHAESEEAALKTVEELEKVRSPPEIREQTSPMAELLDGADLSDAVLRDISPVRRTSLREADFSNADLWGVDFSESDLRNADLTDAEIFETKFHKSDLRDAKLPMDDFDPLNGDFTGADLRGIEFPDNLDYAEMAKAFLMHMPFNFDPPRGFLESDDRLADPDSSDYFGPPTPTVGKYRRTLMASWPNLPVEKSIDIIGWNADFSGKAAPYANFSGAHLWGADFSDAILEGIDFSGSTLWLADLSNTHLRNADLRGADLRGADLQGADLRGANLQDADLRRTDLSDIIIDGGTKCDNIYENPKLSPEEWGSIARAYHDLKALFSENGMSGRARNCHALQRRARGFEGKARDGWRSPVYISSLISGFFAGYSVNIWPLFTWMLMLFLFSTGWYAAAGVEDTIIRNISFSVITFTAAPTKIPSDIFTQIVVMVETFLGTLFIVLMGYILGNREQF